MSYVDGFVLVVKKDKLDEYREMASIGGKIWKKHGALQYFECVGDDLNPQMPDDVPEEMKGMKMRLFPEMVGTGKGEVVIFSFIIFESKEHRDEVNKKVMADPEMNSEEWKDKPMPFDMRRMAFGGFKVLVEG